MHGFVKRKLGVAGDWREVFRARVVTGRKCDQNSRGPLRDFRAKVKKKWIQDVLVIQNSKISCVRT